MGLSGYQVACLKSSWQSFLGHWRDNEVAIGIAFFRKLFEMFPDIQNKFPKFKGKALSDDLLKSHGGKVAAKITDMVSFLGHTGEWGGHDKDNHGKFHKGIGIGAAYMDKAGKALCALMKAKLGGDFTEEAAWMAFMGELGASITNA